MFTYDLNVFDVEGFMYIETDYEYHLALRLDVRPGSYNTRSKYTWRTRVIFEKVISGTNDIGYILADGTTIVTLEDVCS